MSAAFEVDPRAGKYAKPPFYPLDTETAITIARERINEWSWDEDAHGYCHDRAVLIALVEAAEQSRGPK